MDATSMMASMMTSTTPSAVGDQGRELWENNASGAGNASVEYSRSYDRFTWHAVELLVIPLLMLAGLVGNALVLYIYHARWRISTFSLFIQVLAAVDFTNCLVSMPLLLALASGGATGHSFDPVCRTASVFAIATAVITATVLLIIAVDRYTKICRHERKSIGVHLAKRLCFAAIIAGIVLNIPAAIVFGRTDRKMLHEPIIISYCYIPENMRAHAVLFAYMGIQGLLFTAITASLATLYTLLWRSLRVHARRRGSLSNRSINSIKRSKTERTAKSSTKIFFGVTMLFFLCYMPYFVVIILTVADKDFERRLSPAGKALVDLGKLSPLVNSMANPIIYSFASSRFRQECAKVFTLRPCYKWRRRGTMTKSYEDTHTSEGHTAKNGSCKSPKSSKNRGSKGSRSLQNGRPKLEPQPSYSMQFSSFTEPEQSVDV